MKIPQFLLFFSLIALVMILSGWLVSQYWIVEASFAAMSIATLLSFFTGALAYILTYTGLDKSTRQFSTMLMLGMFSKLVIGILAVLLVVVEFKPVLKSYVVAYIIAYFVFTAFEVYGLMRKLRA